MEKALLVAALIGTVHLVLVAVRRVGHLATPGRWTIDDPWPVTVSPVEKKPVDRNLPALLRKDVEEDWGLYDVPTFIRRGIPMPVLEPVPAKKPAKRKKAVKKSPVEENSQTDPRFEVVL